MRTLLVFSMWLFTGAALAAERPNVVVIVADDLGYADLGVQGGTDVPTPHLDALANGGVRFTNGYVSGVYCSPTRAGLMTGRYQTRFGHEFNPHVGPDEIRGLTTAETTMAQRMRDAGYATGAVGKWHLGYVEKFHPQSRGFDEFFGFLNGAHDYFLANDSSWGHIMRGREESPLEGYLTEVLSREATDFIHRHRGEPFFLYLAYNAVHTPSQAPPEYVSRFAHIADERRRIYCAMLAALDDGVGQVLNQLNEDGLDEKTLVFFISDNGGPTNKFAQNGSINTPLRGSKGDTWEGGVRVPFFARWTGTFPAGKVVDQPVIQLDILPTALAAAGVTAETAWALDGVNLLPLAKGVTNVPPHDALYWRFGNHFAVRQGDWKMVRTWDNDRPQLFDLANDISEANDLSAQEPERLAKMVAMWQSWNSEMVPPAFPTNHPLEGDPNVRSPATPKAKSKAKTKGTKNKAKGASVNRPDETILAQAPASEPSPARPAGSSARQKGKAMPPGVKKLADLEYARRGDMPLLLDLYLPEHASGKLPVVVWIHGGGWNKGSKSNCPGVYLAAEGYAVASVDYRLSTVAQWPAQIDDCRDAIRWLRTHSDQYDLDPDHVAVWGGSAGGHLVALLGTLPEATDEAVSSRVQAVCDWYGPADLLTMPSNVLNEGKTRDDLARSNGAQLLGGVVMDMPDRARSASALAQVSSDDAAFLIMHGDLDPQVPLSQSTRLDEALRAAGVDCRLVVVEGAGHGGPGFQTDEARRTVRDFFDKHLKAAH